jgi:hypothetical protein
MNSGIWRVTTDHVKGSIYIANGADTCQQMLLVFGERLDVAALNLFSPPHYPTARHTYARIRKYGVKASKIKLHCSAVTMSKHIASRILMLVSQLVDCRTRIH